MSTNETTIKPGIIFQQICLIKDEIDVVGKSKQNTQQNYSYRGIEDMVNMISPLLAKHKVFIIPTVLETVRDQIASAKGNALNFTMLKVAYRLYAADSSFIESIVVGEGMDSGDKSSSKAMTAAYKKALEQIFCIPTAEIKDSDSDAQLQTGLQRTIPTQQPQSSYTKSQQPAQSNGNGANFIAHNLADMATPKQLGAIRSAARIAGVDPEEECEERLKCKLSELSKRGASWMIDHLQPSKTIN